MPLLWLVIFVVACRWFSTRLGAVAVVLLPVLSVAVWFVAILALTQVSRQKVCSGPGKVPALTSAA